MLGAKRVTHPIEQNHSFATSLSESFSNPTRYHRLVGRLIYLVITHPDLSYAIHVISKFMDDPKIDHLEAAVRVVHYLKANLNKGYFSKLILF